MGRNGGRRLRGDAAGEIPGHSGVPLRPLCGPGDPHPAVSPRGAAAAAAARLPAGLEGETVMTAPPILQCSGLTCRFGGVVALDRIDFSAREGEIVGLIGPNGSGKTTLFNVITGIYRAQDGRITFAGSDLTRARPQAVYHAGITRTFQRSRVCLPLSVFDNIMIGNHKRLNHGVVLNLVRLPACAAGLRRS